MYFNSYFRKKQYAGRSAKIYRMSEMDKPLLIIKIGGSVITDKESHTPKLRAEVVKRLTKEIASIYKERKYRIILIHGAGSFGHPIVKKHNLQRGMQTMLQKLAYSQTLQNMIKLNNIVVQNLINLKVPVVSLPPHTFAVQNAGRLSKLNLKVIEMCLKNGQVPVLFGDAILDKKWGCSILSGDTIAPFLAKKLGAEKVIFVSDVDGVFTSDPKKDPRAKLIPLIDNLTVKNLLKGAQSIQTDTKIDVTGEMYGKVMSIKRNLRGIQAFITNGLAKNSLKGVLQNTGRSTKLYFKH